MARNRHFRDVPDLESGLTFRFFSDRADPTRLHIEAAHGVSVEGSIATFFAGTSRWLPEKRCFETSTETHALAWLWLDEPARTRVMVITCVPHL